MQEYLQQRSHPFTRTRVCLIAQIIKSVFFFWTVTTFICRPGLRYLSLHLLITSLCRSHKTDWSMIKQPQSACYRLSCNERRALKTHITWWARNQALTSGEQHADHEAEVDGGHSKQQQKDEHQRRVAIRQHCSVRTHLSKQKHTHFALGMYECSANVAYTLSTMMEISNYWSDSYYPPIKVHSHQMW